MTLYQWCALWALIIAVAGGSLPVSAQEAPQAAAAPAAPAAAQAAATQAEPASGEAGTNGASAQGTVPAGDPTAEGAGGASPAAPAADIRYRAVPEAAHEEVPLGSVALSPEAEVQVAGPVIWSGGGRRLLHFSLRYKNAGAGELEFMEYGVRLYGAGAQEYKVKLLPKEQPLEPVIPPYSERTIEYYAEVGDGFALEDAVFRLIRWDFGTAGFQSVLGDLAVPAEYEYAVPAGTRTAVMLDGSRLNAYAGAFFRYPGPGREQGVTAFLHLASAGAAPVKLTGLEAWLELEGRRYPMKDAEAWGELTAGPSGDEPLSAQFDVPVDADWSGARLWLTRKASEEAGGEIDAPLGSFALGEPRALAEEKPLAPGGVQIVEAGRLPLEVSVDRVFEHPQGRLNGLSVLLRVKNASKVAVKLPSYEYALRSGEGKEYGAEPAGLEEETRLQPGEELTVKLEGALPYSADASKASVLVKEPAGEEDEEAEGHLLPLAHLALPAPSQEEWTPETAHPLRTKSGTFPSRLISIKRSPHLQEDLLTAEVRVRGESGKAKPLPAMTGYFLLDDSTRIEASPVVLSPVGALRDSDEASLYWIGRVPFKTKFSGIKLVLEEETGEGGEEEKAATKELAAFRTDGTDAAIPLRKDGGSRRSALHPGYSAVVKQARSFSGPTGQMAVVLVEQTNAESRSMKLPALPGYFRTPAGGLYLPAQHSEIAGEITPDGSALVAYWTRLPYGRQADDLQLVLGEAVVPFGGTPESGEPPAAADSGADTAASSSAGDDEEDGSDELYVNPAAYPLPEEPDAKDTLQELVLYPFSLSVTKVERLNEGGQTSYRLNYTLDRGATYESHPEGRQVAIEVETEDHHVTTKTYALGWADGEESGGEGSDVLATGDRKLTIEQEGTGETTGAYRVRIYEVFQNQRVLLAEDEYP
ncbi:hypothetical protein J2T17_000512 [Paenibacillus mucilaginosus]|uniref:hypothetical protein n=1 Tax=Paenibacillus mucilaginosus TaxID=61624 RepID=UPI003D2289C0